MPKDSVDFCRCERWFYGVYERQTIVASRPIDVIQSRCERMTARVMRDDLKLIFKFNLWYQFIVIADYSCIADHETGSFVQHRPYGIVCVHSAMQ